MIKPSEKLNLNYIIIIILLNTINIINPFSCIFVSLPILILSYVNISKNKLLMYSVIFCVILSEAIKKLLYFNNFNLLLFNQILNTGTASLNEVIHKIIDAIPAFLSAYDANIFGQQTFLSVQFILSACCLSIILLGILALYNKIKFFYSARISLKNISHGIENFNLLLIIGLISNILAVFLSNSLTAMHDLLPAVFFIVIFLSLNFFNNSYIRSFITKLNIIKILYKLLGLVLILKIFVFLRYDLHEYNKISRQSVMLNIHQQYNYNWPKLLCLI